MKVQKRARARGPSAGTLVLETPLRPALEAALDGWQDSEVDDDCLMKDDELPYCASPGRGANRLLRAAREVPLPAAALARLKAKRPALVRLLTATSLDDLDSAATLAWVMEAGDFAFQDGPRRVALPLEEERRLVAAIARVVDVAVHDGVDAEGLARRVLGVLRAWAAEKGLEAKTLRRFVNARLVRRDDGCVWYVTPAAQRGVVRGLVNGVAALLDVRWADPPGRSRPYAAGASFVVGERVSHPKFGEGEVLQRLDGKVEIRFEDGARTLATTGSG